MPGEFGPSLEEMGIKPPIQETNQINQINMPDTKTITSEPNRENTETELNVAQKEREKVENYVNTELVERVQGMEKAPATFKDLNETLEPTVAELRKKDPEQAGMLEKRLNNEDKVTGIPGRENQNDHLRIEIFERLKEKDTENRSKNLGMISFDLRSLKLVNDAVGNHELGDEYLRRVAQKAQEISANVSASLGIEFSISRDGGDEFSIVFTSENVNLEQKLEKSGLELEKMLEAPMELGKERVIDAISQYISQEIAKDTHNDLFLESDTKVEYDKLTREGKIEEANALAKEGTKKALERYVNKGIEDEELHLSMPKEFDLRSFVASGGSTLYEVLNNPQKDDYKTMETPKSELHALNLLAGSMRAKSDKEAYRQKEEQNKEITRNRNEMNEFRMNLLSRNEFTRSIILERRKLEKELKQCLSNK